MRAKDYLHAGETRLPAAGDRRDVEPLLAIYKEGRADR